ncbi:MAG TPA: hypothetical protein VN758_10420 [Solirubrobacterales bacterium]|nr:hypothetical protein [Solirubrobacterales bacterium]
MRPERDNIAAPDLPAGLVWLGEEPRSMPVLTAAGPVLVHFFDYAQLNSVRTLPYLIEWDRRYREAGLRTIGVQSPRFPFGADPLNVGAGLRDLGVEFPVAIDAERQLWHAYGCEGWPSLFLWTTGGALSWFHFGEGEYGATEEAIQAELRELDALRSLPEPMEPLRPSDAPGALVMPPTEELFPGGSWEKPFIAGQKNDGERIDIPYAAGGAYISVDGEGEIGLERDNKPVDPVVVTNPGLYPLAEHPGHEPHRVGVIPTAGMRIWSVSFAAGIASTKGSRAAAR